jgi:hypothetical protein
MDPEDSLTLADQEVSDCNSCAAHVALQNYRDWRASGGFEPLHVKGFPGRGDQIARSIARRLEDLDRQNAAGFVAFLEEFPQTIQGYGTGGGCTAWLIEKTRGGKHILMTDDNLTQPSMSDSFVSVGSYDEDGQTISDAESGTKLGEKPYLLTWDEAREWVRAELAKL